MLPTNESLSQKFIRRGFWIYFFSFLVAPTGYFIKIIVSGEVSVEEVGVMYGIIGLLSIAILYNDFGLSESIAYFLPKYLVEKEIGRAKGLLVLVGGVKLVTGCIIGGLGWMFAEEIGTKWFGMPNIGHVIQIYASFFFAYNVIDMAMAVCLALQNTKWQKGLEAIRMFTVLIVTVSVWQMGIGDMYTYALAWLAGVIIGGLCAIWFLYVHVWRTTFSHVKMILDREKLRPLMSYSFSILLANNIAVVMSQIDLQLIIQILGNRDAGYYTNYLSLVNIPFMILTPIVGLIFPVVSEMYSRGEYASITKIHSFFVRYFASMGVAVAGFFITLGPSIASAFFGDKFVMSGYILSVVAVFLVWNMLLQINFQILGGLGAAKKRTKILLFGLGINLVLNITLIYTFVGIGLPGVWGSGIATGLSWIPLWYLSHREIRIYSEPFDWKFLLKNIVLSAILSAILYMVWQTFQLHEMPRSTLFLGVALAGIFYILPFVFANLREFRLMRDEIRKFRR